MDVEKESYSSSLGVQVAAINFAVKYRHAIFANPQVKVRAEQSFMETERAHGGRTGLKIVEMGVDRDHAHLVVQWGPGHSLPDARPAWSPGGASRFPRTQTKEVLGWSHVVGGIPLPDNRNGGPEAPH